MASYVAEMDVKRGGWCVFAKKAGTTMEYVSGPFLRQSAIDQAKKHCELGGICTCGAGDDSNSHLVGCPYPVPPGGVRYFSEKDLFPHRTVQKSEGMKYVTSLPDDEQCVSMLEFKGTMYVATSKGVYRMVGDKLEAVQFVVKEEE